LYNVSGGINPPSLDAANNDPLLNAFKNRNNINLQQQPSPNSFLQPNSLHIVNGVNPNFNINRGQGNLSLNPTQDQSRAYIFKQKENPPQNV
jgi:hypothetical protein